ncbi:hypothetical protein AMQ83_34305, partial [Paenibacillus riograndensis]
GLDIRIISFCTKNRHSNSRSLSHNISFLVSCWFHFRSTATKIKEQQILNMIYFQNPLFEEVYSIDLLVDGESPESLMGHAELEHPINRE